MPARLRVCQALRSRRPTYPFSTVRRFLREGPARRSAASTGSPPVRRYPLIPRTIDRTRAGHRACVGGGAVLVWYTAYGSNMHADRLRYYLLGGHPPGATRAYPGCRDPRPPARTIAVALTGGIYFALESRTWSGGMCFYDRDLPGPAVARAYLITASQFSDIAAQEMYEPPGVDIDRIDEAVASGSVTLGPGRYETLVCPGSRDGHPLLTFTAPWSAAEVDWNPPAPAYLARLAGGIREAHGWDADRITDYLSARPGIDGRLDRATVVAVVTAGLGQAGSDWLPEVPERPRDRPPTGLPGSSVAGVAPDPTAG